MGLVTDKATSVPTSVYAVFVALQLASIIFAYLLVPPTLVVRKDGSHLAIFRKPSVAESLIGLKDVLKDWRVLIMIPAYFTPEVSLVMSSSFNAYAYNLRTRSLNNFLVHLIQIPLALIMGWILDNERFGRRRTRALIAITIDTVWITGVYIAQTIWLHSWNFDRSVPGPSIDLHDAAYPGAVIIQLIYGAQYGIFQNVVLWILGSLSNEPKKTALMGGIFVSGRLSDSLLDYRIFRVADNFPLYKVLSAGTAVAFGVDATAPNYKAESGGWFGVTTLCWPILYFLAFTQVTDTNYDKEPEVIVPVDHQEKVKMVLAGDIEGRDVELTESK
jgi:hypothetical protein